MPRPGRPGLFLGRPIELFRIAGIGIAVHASWLIVAVAVSVLFRFYLLDHVKGAAGAAAAVGVMLIFYSFVLMHELAHALVARHHGLQPKRIVLFLLGGVSQIEKESTRPSHEYQVALAGPLLSLIIAGLLFAVARLLHGGTAPSRAGVWGWLAWLNLLLAGFNLVPGFPLDGGRVLRSALWAWWGDRARATRVAALGGRVVACAIIGFGLVMLFVNTDDAASASGPISFMVVGWFLYSMAGLAGEREGALGPGKPLVVRAEPGKQPSEDAVAEPAAAVDSAAEHATEAVPPAAPAAPVLPARDIIPSSGRRGAKSRGLPPPTPAPRPARAASRVTPPAKGASLSAKTSAKPGRAHESSSSKSVSRGRGAGSADRARSSGRARAQSRDGARHSRAGSADARGRARRRG